MVAVGLVACALTLHASAVQLQVAKDSSSAVQFQARPSTAKHQCESGGFQVGDGSGGSERYVGRAADYEGCLHMVKEMAPDANGATIVKGGGGCYAEIGMTSIASGSLGYLSCKFKSTPAGPQPTSLPAEDSTADDRCVNGAWQVGDGSGFSEEYVGYAADYEDCLNMVKEMAPDANGATVVKGGGGCYAEIGMTGVASGSISYLTCQVRPSTEPPTARPAASPKAPRECGANTGQCLDALAGQYINPATIYEPATASYDKLISSGWQFDPAENTTWSFKGTGLPGATGGEVATMSYTFYNKGSLCMTIKNNNVRGTVLVVYNGDTLASLTRFSSQTITRSVSPGDKLELSEHGDTIMQISSWSFTCPT